MRRVQPAKETWHATSLLDRTSYTMRDRRAPARSRSRGAIRRQGAHTTAIPSRLREHGSPSHRFRKCSDWRSKRSPWTPFHQGRCDPRKPDQPGASRIDAAKQDLKVHDMKKVLIIVALAAGVTTMASMKAGSSSVPGKDAAGLREARACDVLLRKMSQSPDTDTWRNRMRAWTCRQRSDAASIAAAEAG